MEEEFFIAEPLLSYVSIVLTTYEKFADGMFLAYLNISLENDGLVPIILQSENGQLKL